MKMPPEILTFLLRGGHLDVEERKAKGLWPNERLRYSEVLDHLAAVIEHEEWFPRMMQPVDPFLDAIAPRRKGLAEISPTRRFELVDGTSRQFWEIRRFVNTVAVRAGRIGTCGQSSSREFATLEAAEEERKNLIQKRMAKGYKKARQ